MSADQSHPTRPAPSQQSTFQGPSTGTPVHASDIAAGAAHTCAITAQGTLCWGLNGAGQLGNGNTMMQTRPTMARLTTTATQISAAANNTCAVLSDTSVACWGDNSHGQLGNGMPALANSSFPVPVQTASGAALMNAVEVRVGFNFACARLNTGGIVWWGNNQNGQLSESTSTASSPVAVPVSPLPAGTPIRIDLGDYFACALISNPGGPHDGGITCWGRLDDGVFGHTETSSPMFPPLTPVAIGASSIAAADYTQCGIFAGQVECAGYNGGRLLTNGTTGASVSAFLPIEIDANGDALNGATSIASRGARQRFWHHVRDRGNGYWVVLGLERFRVGKRDKPYD